jgi:hypothetical protein
MAIHNWWENKVSKRSQYADRTYPNFFSPTQLKDKADRAAWFTMFALACFHSFGRTQDGQHRVFLERGWREGWWQELASSRPPAHVHQWLDRLESWSSPEELEQSYLPWRRTFVDLYTVARWLDEYVELVSKLPRIVQARGPISLNDILRPSYSPLVMGLGIDAAPLSRSIGIGMNWMLRELLRSGVYASQDEASVAPYSWASSARVRGLLKMLGADFGDRADKESSRAVYEFVVDQVGPDYAQFDRDFDLPLQLITREEHRVEFEQCFKDTGRRAPELRNWGDDFGGDPTD